MDLAFGWLSECLLGYPVGASAEEIRDRVRESCL